MFLLQSDIKKFHAIDIVEKYDGNYMKGFMLFPVRVLFFSSERALEV